MTQKPDLLHFCKALENHPDPVVRRLASEYERLRRGDFTDEELLVIAANPRFQDLCHNLPPEVGLCKYADGCDEYQRKLFGKSRTDGYHAIYAELLSRIEAAESMARDAVMGVGPKWVDSVVSDDEFDEESPEVPPPCPICGPVCRGDH